MTNIMKPCKFLLILYITILNITGSVGKPYDDMHKSSGTNIKETLSKLVSSVRIVMRAFEEGLLVGYEGGKYNGALRNNLARKCQKTTRANGLTLTAQANSIMQILQEFFGILQQIQVDLVSMSGGKTSAVNFNLTRSIRHLEYDLRDVTETKLRRFITEYIGPVKVPYSLGSLPSNASVGVSEKILIKHYYKLAMLRSCIDHILHIDRWRYLMMDNSTKHMFMPRDLI